MRQNARKIVCTLLILSGLSVSPWSRGQIAVYDDSASYEAVVGSLLFASDFTGGTNALTGGSSFHQLVDYRSVAPNASVVFWSAAAGGIQNATGAAGGLSAQLYGLTNALALRFSASPTPPTVTVFDALGSVIDTRAASAGGFYGVVSPTSIRRVEITGSQVLTLVSFQANQESVPQSDTTRPQVTALSIVPQAIDVTAASQSVTVTAGVTDDLSGVAAAWVRFISPSLQQSTDFVFLNTISGDALNQTRSAVVSFPPFIEAGTWQVSIFVRDVVDNDGTVPTDALATLGLPTTLEIVSNEDTEPPELIDFSFTPNQVDVTGGDQSVVVSLGLRDAVAGLDLSNSLTTVRVISPSGLVTQQIFAFRFVQVSGTPQDGTWEGILPMPQFSEAGNWTIDFVWLEDAAGNRRFYGPPALIADGFTDGLSVISGPEDLQSPQLIDFSFTPALVNTTAGSATVSISAELTDNLSGVRGNFIDFFRPPFIQFRSPSGQQSRFDYLDLATGSALAGVWTGQIVLPQFSEQGNYAPTFLADDLVGNRARLFDIDLQNLGFATNLVVIRPSLIVDGTIVPADGGTVNDNVFGSSASVSFPPGAVDVPTDVAIDVFVDPPLNTTPVGFQAVGSLFVNIDLTPEPNYPLPPPGLTVTLPMSPPGVPGTQLILFRVNPATLTLEPVFNFDGTLLTGTVNPDGQSATFFGIRFLSLVVGFVPADPGDLNADECIDRTDFAIISDAIRDVETASILLDLNGDGAVNRADARTLIGLFTNPNGMPCSIANELINPPVDPGQLHR